MIPPSTGMVAPWTYVAASDTSHATAAATSSGGPGRPAGVPAVICAPTASLSSYLRLLETAGPRLRRCANPTCTLRFHDVSKAGGRRWCSMAICGNRAKARTHYARQRGTG